MTRPTYEDIVGRTVPAPDSSYRPTDQQRQDTAEGKFVPDDDDHLAERVRAALGDHPGITVEVSDNRVSLRGAVKDIAVANQIEALVGGVEGVGAIDNRIHVA